MVFSYSPEYACTHLFDAAYVCKGSYAQAYFTLCIKYGRDLAIQGYREHTRRKSSLIQYDWIN